MIARTRGAGLGLPRYTFKSACQENPLANLDDKSLKIVYNASAYEAEKDERLKALLRFVQTNEPGQDDFSKRLSAIVEQTKENEKFRQEYAAMNLHDYDIMREAKQEGLAEGIRQKAVEAAALLVKEFGATPENAAQKMGAPLDKLLEALSVAETA